MSFRYKQIISLITRHYTSFRHWYLHVITAVAWPAPRLSVFGPISRSRHEGEGVDLCGERCRACASTRKDPGGADADRSGR